MTGRGRGWQAGLARDPARRLLIGAAAAGLLVLASLAGGWGVGGSQGRAGEDNAGGLSAEAAYRAWEAGFAAPPGATKAAEEQANYLLPDLPPGPWPEEQPGGRGPAGGNSHRQAGQPASTTAAPSATATNEGASATTARSRPAATAQPTATHLPLVPTDTAPPVPTSPPNPLPPTLLPDPEMPTQVPWPLQTSLPPAVLSALAPAVTARVLPTRLGPLLP